MSLEEGATDAVDLTIDNSAGAASVDWSVDTEAVVANDPRGHFPDQPWQGAVLGDFNVSRDPFFSDVDQVARRTVSPRISLVLAVVR